MIDAAIYVRLSEEDRNKIDRDKDSESIVNQKSILSDYATEKGWRIYRIYSDDDYSGADSTRPGFNEMIKDAKQKKFQVLLCKSLSRFARDVSMVETYINGLFIELGIRFISIADYADTSQKGSRKNIQINSLVNQWYLEDLSENIKSVMRHKKKQGQYTGAFAPYGYLKDPKDRHKLIVDPDASAIVQRIYSRYLEGWGCKAIATELNNEEIPCPSAYRKEKGIKTNRINSAVYRWSDNSVSQILSNPNYTGTLVQCRFMRPTYKSKTQKKTDPNEWISVENAHDAIVSADEYNAVQQMKKARGRKYTPGAQGAGQQNIFSGLLWCKLCGRALVISSSGGRNNNTKYLRCTGRKSGITDCMCAMMKYDRLIEIVTENVRNIISNYCDFNELEERVGDQRAFYLSEISALQKTVERLKIDCSALDEALGNLYLDKTTGLITAEQFTILTDNLNKKKRDAIEQINTTTLRISKVEEILGSRTRSKKIAAKYEGFSKLTPEIVREFIDKIQFGKRNGKEADIEIYWRV